MSPAWRKDSVFSITRTRPRSCTHRPWRSSTPRAGWRTFTTVSNGSPKRCSRTWRKRGKDDPDPASRNSRLRCDRGPRRDALCSGDQAPLRDLRKVLREVPRHGRQGADEPGQAAQGPGLHGCGLPGGSERRGSDQGRNRRQGRHAAVRQEADEGRDREPRQARRQGIRASEEQELARGRDFVHPSFRPAAPAGCGVVPRLHEARRASWLLLRPAARWGDGRDAAQYTASSSETPKMPEYIFGKKWVDFCGRRSPAPTTASTSDTVVARMRIAAWALPASTAAMAASASEVKEMRSPFAITSVRMPRSLSKKATSRAATSRDFHSSERPSGQGRGWGLSFSVIRTGLPGGA